MDLIEPLEEVCEQAERAGDILRHVRDFVRKSEPRMKPMDVNQIMRAWSNSPSTRRASTHAGDAASRFPTAQGGADSIMIEQVICNLVRNAIEAMARRLSPRAKSRSAPAVRIGDSVEIEIVDSGPGIDGSLIDQVFDQFFTTKPEGVGMGLAISRSIIESHGGTVRAESSRTAAPSCASP
jgi:C4-dicarboxylate-specific signal transduction histidine kinase